MDRLERNIELLFKGIDALKESQTRTDEQLRKTDEQLNRTIKKLDDIGRQLGDLGLVQGEVAEDLFYRNMVKDEVGRYAEKAGLYVLMQTSEGGATLLNRKNFKAKAFN